MANNNRIEKKNRKALSKLSETRMLERTFYPMLELTDKVKNTFPKLSPVEQEILAIEQKAPDYDNDEIIFCTPYVRTNTDGTWFADLYFAYLDWEKRIIIAPGYGMTEEDEIFFASLFDRDQYIVYNGRIAGSFQKEIMMVAPELHLNAGESLMATFKHIYYCSYPSGIRELLYKSGLIEIATDLDCIDEYNMLGSSMEEAFGLPIVILRKLNHREAIENILRTEDSRRMVKVVYKNYHSFLNCYDRINSYQIRYLYSLLGKAEKPDKTVLKALSTIEEGYDENADEYIAGEEVYQQYMEYIGMLNSLGGRKRKQFPKNILLDMKHTKQFYYSHRLLKHCIENVSYLEQFFEWREEWVKRYTYENETYQIVVPETIADLLKEGEQQHNCLQTIIEDDILDGDSIILFMRDKKKPKKSLVTVELQDDTIRQARRKFNEDCLEEEKEFLLEFAKAKNVDPGVLLGEEYEGRRYMQIPDVVWNIVDMPNEEGENRIGFLNIPMGIEEDVPFV